MKLRIFECMAVAIVFSVSAVRAPADDVNQPPWERFLPDTTYQNFTFPTNSPVSLPEMDYYNPNGTPLAASGGESWWQSYDQRIGVWNLFSNLNYIDFTVPNTPYDPTREKIVWTQVTWEPGDVGSPLVTVYAGVDGFASTLVSSSQIGTSNWIQSTYEAVLPYNPIDEVVDVRGDMRVDEVVIDTICVPEPATWILLVLAGTALLGWPARRLLYKSDG